MEFRDIYKFPLSNSRLNLKMELLIKKKKRVIGEGERTRYLIGQKFGGQNCRKFRLVPKILSAEKFCPPKILSAEFLSIRDFQFLQHFMEIFLTCVDRDQYFQ